MPALPFLGPTYTSRSRSVNAQRTVNLYPEVDPTGTAKNQQGSLAALYGTPGLKRLWTLPGRGGIRGLYASSSGALYGVQGPALFRYMVDGTWSQLGTLQTSEGPVSFADNGMQVCLVDGDYGYISNESGQTFGQIADADFLGSARVVYIDGYFAFTQPGAQRFYLSQLLEGNSLDSLDFASAESLPDRLVTLATNQREVWLFGEQSTEIWYNAGTQDFPFVRIQGAVLDYGCEAPLSVASVESDLCWLGTTEGGAGRVYKQQGYQVVPISTHAVEIALARMIRRDDAWAFGYQEAGHAFYVLTFPTSEQTWVYDLTTELWHERASLGADGVLRAWRIGAFTRWNGLLLGGDRATGNIYQLDLATYTDNGGALPRIRTAPHLSAPDLTWWHHHRFQLDLDVGVGLDGGVVPGTTPQVMLQWSNDGGATWSSEQWVTAGAIGQYRTRALWRRLGKARDRVYRVMVTDPVPVALIGATIDASAGRA